MELRPYQRAGLEAVRARFRAGDRRTLLVWPTGAGKTVVFAEIARLAALRRRRVLVIAHRTELLTQAIAKITGRAPELVVAREQGSAHAAAHANVVVASVQTLARASRLAKWAPDFFDIVIVDEAHHAAAETYQRILAHFANAYVLGVTATPDRGDGQTLRETFPSVAHSVSMLELIRQGYLAPLVARTVEVDGFDVNGVRVVHGDLAAGGLARALEEPGVLDSVARAIAQHAGGRSTLVFVPAVETAHALATFLADHEGGAIAIDGETDDGLRAHGFERFLAGDARYLVNVGVATEGTDLPICSCVAVVRPTMSRPLFVQMVGRGSRPHPGKTDCLVLNFAPSNCRHRLVRPVEALLGDELDDLTKQAIRELAELEPDASLDELLKRAPERVDELRAELERVSTIRSRLHTWDPLGILDVEEPKSGFVSDVAHQQAWQICEDAGVRLELMHTLSRLQIVAVAKAIERRKRRGLCSMKQARKLAQQKLNPNVSPADASYAMQKLRENRWRVPLDLRMDPRFRLKTEDTAA